MPPQALVGAIFRNFRQNRKTGRNRAWLQMSADVACSIGNLSFDDLNRVKVAEQILGDIEDRVKGGEHGSTQSPLSALQNFLATGKGGMMAEDEEEAE